jgi:small subunit ribosomal protein S9
MVTKKNTYIESIGRRKTASARVRITASGKNEMTVNGKTVEAYFGLPKLAHVALSPVVREDFAGKYEISVKVEGSGPSAQAEAIRLGVARALVKEDAETRPALKALGYLKRDARKVERKHFGHKKARKSSQWSKR